jgi:hypothetical protein
VSSHPDNEPRTRRERLTAIAADYTEEIHDPRTEKQLAGAEPVSRFAAVTSEGSIESSYASNGNLIVADGPPELAELLRQECGEGWLAHGRAWDLDAPFDLWGNLEIGYRACVGEDCARPVHAVRVHPPRPGLYLFDDRLDAEAFRKTVHHHGARAAISEEVVHDHRAADALIDEQRRP